jgi:Rieske Fe-S protein
MNDPKDLGQPERLWHEEFSIAATEQGYVERRQFGRFLLLTSGAMFAGQLWLVAKSLFSKAAETVWPRRAIARVEEIPPGGTKVFQYPAQGDDCLLVRLDEHRFAAYSQKCTHLSCAVIYSAEARRLECPCHEGYFSIDDGHVLQGPPPRPLPKVELEIRGAEVFATGMSVFGQES